MAEIAVSIALFLVEKVLSSLNQVPAPLRTKVRGEVQDITDSLKTMQPYFRDMGSIEGSEVLEDRVKQVRIIAYAAEDVLDEIMLHLTHRDQRHKISKKTHELGHAVADQFSSHRKEISSKMEDIKRRIDRFTALDPLCRGGGGRGFTISGEGTSSSSRAENLLFTGHVGDDFERVGYDKPMEKLVNQLKSTEPGQTTVSLVGPCGSGKSVLAKMFTASQEMRYFLLAMLGFKYPNPRKLRRSYAACQNNFVHQGMNQFLMEVQIQIPS